MTFEKSRFARTFPTGKSAAVGALFGVLLAGCSSMNRSANPEAEQAEKVDSLLVFKEAVASGPAGEPTAPGYRPATKRRAVLSGINGVGACWRERWA